MRSAAGGRGGVLWRMRRRGDKAAEAPTNVTSVVPSDTVVSSPASASVTGFGKPQEGTDKFSMNSPGRTGLATNALGLSGATRTSGLKQVNIRTKSKSDDNLSLFERKLLDRFQRLRARSRALCDSWRFSVLTTVLTFYALFGDDFRVSLTHRRTDFLFNILTILSIVVFSTEIVACSLGKEAYFMGFFFLLDCVSTVTLLFDLTMIANAIFCQDGVQKVGQSKSGRAAGRVGARASRIVRVIRLIRLVKLYKTYKTAIDSKARDSSPSSSNSSRRDSPTSLLLPGEEGDDEEEDAAVQETEEREGDQRRREPETRVGRKLSDMTTRRVICLILLMLFVMPQFSATSHDQEFFSSGELGPELIYERWRAWCPENATTSSGLPWCFQDAVGPDAVTSDVSASEARWWYERYLLDYLYTHRDGKFAWKLYWVGFKSDSLLGFLGDASSTDDYLGQLLQLAQETLLGEFYSPSSTWDATFTSSSWDDKVTALPDTVKRRLTEPWTQKCSDHLGVALGTSGEEESDHPSACSIDAQLRCSEVALYGPLTATTQEKQAADMMFAFDRRGTTQVEAALNMLQTIFICFAVGLGAMSFSSDANQLLLNPIERMIAKMETIKDNPLEAMKLGDREYRLEELAQTRLQENLAKKGQLSRCLWLHYQNRKVKEPMETVILEKTIIKLGGLLALGFGEAGAEIIGQNMKGGHSAGVNAMVPGQKVDAIIGFCNIRHFSVVTEVLKENVMLFVNLVGEIVHGCVDDYHGAPNKNIGDAFLLVWRLPTQSSEQKTMKLADMATMSFVRIVAAINQSPVLAEYRGHPGLLMRLPNFRVEMGFGLHCGWAIEGAIGSEFKIDASYLSPNVNVASRLEAATTQFGVWVLISHFMVGLCSPQMAALCRLIDHVTVKGSKQPVRLYTIDLDYMRLDVKALTPERAIKNRFKCRQLREVRKQEKLGDEYSVWEAFSREETLVRMRGTFQEEFFQRFSMAYRNYEAGEWMVARDMFFTCHYEPRECFGSSMLTTEDEWPVDGPTVTLLRFMRRHGFIPPAEWPGHRELASK